MAAAIAIAIAGWALAITGWALFFSERQWYQRAMDGWKRAIKLWGEGTDMWVSIHKGIADAAELRERISNLTGEEEDRLRRLVNDWAENDRPDV
jgi:hypothetical protein